MKNATIKIRCISADTLESILELIGTECNSLAVESWNTNETSDPSRSGAIHHYRADADPKFRGCTSYGSPTAG